MPGSTLEIFYVLSLGGGPPGTPDAPSTWPRLVLPQKLLAGFPGLSNYNHLENMFKNGFLRLTTRDADSVGLR